MAATYSPVPRHIHSAQRVQQITNVVVGDRIDIIDVLGRSARGVTFFMTNSTDTVSYRLNSLLRLRQANETSADTEVLIWAVSDEFPAYSASGQTQHTTQDGLRISSVEITALTLSAGTTITMTVW